MPASIGVNLRVTGHCSQGGRKYMEDLFSVAYQQTEDEKDLEYAFFGIYDGHGGREAAAFAKEQLMDSIVKQRQFWSDDDQDVLKAIRNGYMLTHLNMWKEIDKWPKTVTGLPSTAGTTASVAFIRRGKIYIGHVGDSAIVLGYQNEGSDEWEAKPLTLDHKPESAIEMERIQRSGGKVISKAGVPRVVWNRPRQGHKGPISKNTPVDEIPFLAVARSLGDLWSYNVHNDEFIVSPDPDVGVLTIDPAKFRCLIFGTDGLWNMTSPKAAVDLVRATEKHNETAVMAGNSNGGQPRDWLNPSKSLVDSALEKWASTKMRADNTSVVTLMLDPPGPPRAAVLKARSAPSVSHDQTSKVPENGLSIVTKYSDGERLHAPPPMPSVQPIPQDRIEVPTCIPETEIINEDAIANYGNPCESTFIARLLNKSNLVNMLSSVYEEIGGTPPEEHFVTPERTSLPPENTPEITPGIPVCSTTEAPTEKLAPEANLPVKDVDSIQINEVSSSSPVESAPKPRLRKPKNTNELPEAGSGRTLRSHDVAINQGPKTRFGTNRGGRVPRPPDRNDVNTTPHRARLNIQTQNIEKAQSKPQIPEPKVMILQKATSIRQTRSRDPLMSKLQHPHHGTRHDMNDKRGNPNGFNPGECVTRVTRITDSECSKENLVSRRVGGAGRAVSITGRKGRREVAGCESFMGREERPRALCSVNESSTPLSWENARGKRLMRSEESALPHKAPKIMDGLRFPIMRNRLRRKVK